MAWNEPGGGGNKDPWSGNGQDKGPPDLDEVVRKARESLGRMFGGKGGGGSGDGDGSGGMPGFSGAAVGVVVAIALLAWLASGLYTVTEGTRGVVLRFGEHVATTEPGLRWHLPVPIERVEKVDVANRQTVEIGYESLGAARARAVPDEALMLTQDENIVNVQLAVQYQVGDPAAFLFNFSDPRATLQQVAESALREAVGKREMDFVLTQGRADVADATRRIIDEALSQYEQQNTPLGLIIRQVAIQDIQPPDEVQDAFADAIKAREDEVRFINEAEAYRNEIVPRANAEAARVLEEATAYRARVVAQAEGETSRFTAVLTEYEQAPRVTRERMYLDAMEQVFNSTSKVMVTDENGDSLMYLPLDKLMEQRRSQAGEGSQNRSGNSNRTTPTSRGSFDQSTDSPSSSSDNSGSRRSRESR